MAWIVRKAFTPIALLSLVSAATIAGDSAVPGSPSPTQVNHVIQDAEFPPIYLSANEMSIATGIPSLVTMANGSTHVPVWSLSGGTVGQSVVGVVNGFPSGCSAVRVEIVVTSTHESTSPDFEDVYRVHLSQLSADESFAAKASVGDCVRTKLPAGPFRTRTIVLDSYYEVQPNTPLTVRVQREPGDPADTFIHPTGLTLVKVTPLTAAAPANVVEDSPGYNSWPMLQAMGNKLVCTYTRGSGHSIGEPARAVYARTSSDAGKTWSAETLVANSPEFGDVTVGKGLDSTGAMLLWVRRVGNGRHHDLYRSTDGVNFQLLATPKLEVSPMQITDIMHVPTVGLVSLWFEGSYSNDGPNHSWGMVTSADDGKTWKQVVVESGLVKSEWPTEPAGVYLGDGKILALARTEMGDNSTVRSQFQMVSTDYGATWKRTKTNIGDVLASTPSLVLDTDTGLVSLYYYHRGHKPGLARRRVVKPETVFNDSLNWPPSQIVTTGSHVTFDAGNANATKIGSTHFVTFYSGAGRNTSVMVSEVAAPR